MPTRTRFRKYQKPLKATPTPRVMLGVGVLVAALFVWVGQTDGPAPRSEAAAGGSAPAAALRHAAALAETAPRLVYRYSVIPGGVASGAALARAMSSDPVVAAHYANFDVARARVVRLEAPQWKHVSYRVGDKVFWTSKKVMLAAGEAVITDGNITARTRCGNQVSDVPMAPVMMANEPAPEVLDMMYASAEGIDDAGGEVPIGQGGAPRAAESPSVQTAAVSGTSQAPRAAPPLLTPLAAPPILSYRGAVTQPAPVPVPPDTPPTNPPTPSNPPKPQDPPTATTPPTPQDPPTATTPPTPRDPPKPPAPQDPPKPPAPPSPPSNPPAGFVPPRAPTPVPEPGSISLMAGALAAMVLLRRKKTRV